MSRTASFPVVYVSGSPREPDAALQFAGGIRAYAAKLEASGVVLLATHGHRAEGRAPIIIDADDRYSVRALELAEQIGMLLKSAGLEAEFGWPWPREFDVWEAMRTAHERAPYPVMQISVPRRFRNDLITLAMKALLPLRLDGVLLVGVSSVFHEAVRRTRASDADLVEVRQVSGAPKGGLGTSDAPDDTGTMRPSRLRRTPSSLARKSQEE